MRVRELSADERAAFRLGRLVAAERCPYFMAGLYAATPVAAEGLGTLAVDRHWRLYLDPALLVGDDRWDAATLGAGLLHEVGHLLRDHAGRADDLPAPVHHVVWNYAGDAEINDDLLAAGIALPEWCVTPSALGLDDGDLAENYYAALAPEDDPDAAPDDDGGAGCGSGSGSPALHGELAPDANVADGSAPAMDDADAWLVRRVVAEAVTEHATTSRGTVPAGLQRWATGVLTPPTVAWQRLLRASVRRAVADRAGRTDYTYRRPSRRRVPRIIKPSMRAPSVIVAVVIDTSGSMSDAHLSAALSEIRGVLRASGIARSALRVMTCDAAVGTAQRVRSVERVRLDGGGGTDMRVGIAAAEHLTPAPHIVICLTDGYTPWPSEPTRARLIAGIIGPNPPSGTPAWATTVHINTGQRTP